MDNNYRANFDSLGDGILAVFQILTLEGWSKIFFIILNTEVNSLISILYVFSWIFIGNLLMLNLFLAILLDGFTTTLDLIDDDYDEK